ncbi:MAG: GIY-YIG nuclease family protein [Spirulinaceae cyanobacterium]
MPSQTDIPSLDTLKYYPYLNDKGYIPEEFQGKIGVYAIFDSEKILQFVGYSRDIYLSLKQHLVRCPQQCHWLKVETINRPSRTILEEIKQAWLQSNQAIPVGNSSEEDKWQKPLDIKPLMSEEEKQQYGKLEEFAQTKLLKKIARRFEADILQEIAARGVKMELRFNPKIKEQGLLDLK